MTIAAPSETGKIAVAQWNLGLPVVAIRAGAENRR
jgi:hypothetical protein